MIMIIIMMMKFGIHSNIIQICGECSGGVKTLSNLTITLNH